MKKLLLCLIALALVGKPALAHEGSWFAAGGSFEHLANGINSNGVGASIEGGYWYLGNVAYGGFFKTSFQGKIDNREGSDLKIYDLGVFWKAASEAGLYGKVLLGLAFISPTGNYSGLRTGNVTSLSLGLGGGFLFPVSNTFQIGPEVIYRHLTSGNGADQISVGVLIAYRF